MSHYSFGHTMARTVNDHMAPTPSPSLTVMPAAPPTAAPTPSVSVSQSTPPPEKLPVTGPDTTLLIVIGIAAVIIGVAVLVWLHRARRDVRV